jgi:large subunit ribosomal protein L25
MQRHMQHIAMEARTRAAKMTKGERKQLRRSGYVMGSLYGRGIEAQSVTVSAKDLVRVLSAEAGVNTLVDLTFNGKRHLIKLSGIEIDPISRALRHVGLHTIKASEPQKATIPVELVGEPELVQTNEAALEQASMTIDVKALPEKMGHSIQLDVSEMQLDEVKYASDLQLPKGFELISTAEMPIVALRAKREMALPEDLETATEDEQELVSEESEAATV